MHLVLESGSLGSLTAPFEWKDIPNFAVVTGPNGSGKTQLLQLLRLAAQSRREHPIGIRCTSSESFSPDDILFSESAWHFHEQSQVLNLQNFAIRRKELAEQLCSPGASTEQTERLRQRLGLGPASQLDARQVARELPSEAVFFGGHVGDITRNLRDVFHGFHIRWLDLRATEELSADELIRRLGRRPWDVANELLSTAAFPYRLSSPVGLGYTEPYELELIAEDKGVRIRPRQLSSGEHVILSLVAALFSAAHYSVTPKLILLDEPDAHLHTSQISRFLDVLRRDLVDTYGCRVVLTTHRPDTIVQVPVENLFEMRRHAVPRVVSAVSRTHVLKGLTAQLIDVFAGMRCVFVEDSDDCEALRATYEALVHEGDLPGVPALEFRSAATGKGTSRVPGGFRAVSAYVEKLRSAGLSVVCGLIDRDQGQHAPVDGVFQLPRHSLENLFFDPLIVFACLIDLERAPCLQGIPVLRPGDEHKLRHFSEGQLQTLVDWVVAQFESECHLLAQSEGTVLRQLTTGARIALRSWVIEHRGHDIELVGLAVGRRLGVDTRLNLKNLIRAQCRSRLAYLEMRDVFAKIQAGG